MPLFHSEMLHYCKELRSGYPDAYNSETIRNIFEEWDIFYLSKNKVISLTKSRCKDFFLLLQEKVRTELITVKRWSRRFTNSGFSWKQILHKIYITTSDKQLRESGYKVFHRILVTNTELKLFKIGNDDLCFQCKNPDSLEHTFLGCPMSIQFYQEILLLFNTLKNTHISLSVDQMLLQNYPLLLLAMTSDADWICLSYLPKDTYIVVKYNEKNLNNLRLIDKIKMQWKLRV